MNQDVQTFISVIIPTHNRLHLLKETLASLAKQTYPTEQYEIIVVDDGSKDGTSDYLAQLAAEGKLRYLRQNQRGPAAARNTGVQVAKGKVVAFTDDDCLPELVWLATLAESYIAQTPSPVAVGGRIENVSEGHWLQQFQVLQNTHSANHAETPDYLDTANASFQRSVFLTLGGFNEKFPCPGSEDIDISFRFLAAGYKLCTNPKAVVWHVGRTSLWGMTKRSFETGIGYGILISEHPNFLAGAPSQGWRLQLRRLLNRLLRLGYRAPQSVRPLACGLVATWRRVLLTVPEIQLFAFTYLPHQLSRYRTLELSFSQIWLYSLLEVYDYAIKLLGRFYGTFRQTYRQVRDDRVL